MSLIDEWGGSIVTRSWGWWWASYWVDFSVCFPLIILPAFVLRAGFLLICSELRLSRLWLWALQAERQHWRSHCYWSVWPWAASGLLLDCLCRGWGGVIHCSRRPQPRSVNTHTRMYLKREYVRLSSICVTRGSNSILIICRDHVTPTLVIIINVFLI